MKLKLVRPFSALVIFLTISTLTIHAETITLYVDNSADQGNGTDVSPFPDLESAITKIKDLRNEYPASAIDVDVIMKGGTYRLNSTITLNAESFAAGMGRTVIKAAPNERVIISGGQLVKGWETASDVAGLPSVAQSRIWEATIGNADNAIAPIRQFWVNGVRMIKASSFDGYSMSRIISSDKTKKCLIVPPVPDYLNSAPDLEVTIIQDWVVNFMRVKKLLTSTDGHRTEIYFEEPESEIEFKRPWPILKANESSHSNHFFYYSNAIELLNRPQEWFFDKKNDKIYYWPRSGETPESIEGVIPVLETLVSIEGTLDNKACDIEFKNIIFEHSAWKRPVEMGHVPLQAGQYIIDAYSDRSVPAGNVAYLGRPAAAISVSNAANVSFIGCDFRNMASSGLDFVSGTTNVTVQGCTFNDIGGNSILAGFFGDNQFEAHQAYNPEDPRVICNGIVIDNNYIANTAAEDWGCLGISIGFAANVKITHNEIFNSPYSAINMGWGWNKADNCMHDNHITANYIHSFSMQMRDSGAIYTLSSQRNSSITGNRVESVGDPQFNPVMWENMPHSQFDIYTDEGSDYFTIHDNWLERGEISKNQNGSHNNWGKNDSTVSSAIKEAAGIEPEFIHIRERIIKPVYAPADSIVEITPRPVASLVTNDKRGSYNLSVHHH